MSAISGFINTIRNAVYGEQVRGAIISALEQCYSDVESPSLNQAAFTAAINAAYAGGILDIITVTQISAMTNQNIIYRYNGTEAGKQKGLYYYSALSSSWVLIGSEVHNVNNSNQMTDTNSIYKYTGTQSGMVQNSLYCYNGTAWVPIGSGVLTASTVAGMTNTGAIYKYTGSETGMVQNALYYHNGTEWTLISIVDTGLNIAGLPADAKATGDTIETLDLRLTDVESRFSDSAIYALIDCLRHVAWVNNIGQYYLNAFEKAMAGEVLYRITDRTFAGENAIDTGVGIPATSDFFVVADFTINGSCPSDSYLTRLLSSDESTSIKIAWTDIGSPIKVWLTNVGTGILSASLTRIKIIIVCDRAAKFCSAAGFDANALILSAQTFSFSNFNTSGKTIKVANKIVGKIHDLAWYNGKPSSATIRSLLEVDGDKWVFEEGSIDSNGRAVSLTGRARTTFFVPTETNLITALDGYSIMLIAWDENSQYVGGYTGESFANQGTFFTEINLLSIKNAYTGYSFKVLAKKDSGNITVTEAYNNVVFE